MKKRLTLFGGDGYRNRIIDIESAAFSENFSISIIVNKAEAEDEFVKSFLHGEIGCPIKLNTDVFELSIKKTCYVSTVMEEGEYVAFTIKVSEIEA